jgi:hypothetical protein
MQLQGIEIYSEPRRGSVRRVQNLKTSWYLKHLPLDKLNQTVSIDRAFNECVKNDPALLAEFLEYQRDIGVVQEIMLATTLTYDDVLELENKLSVKEFDEFVAQCKNAVGGGVQDFFGGSGSDTNSKNQNEKPENSMSTSSSDQHGGSTVE